MRASTAVPLLLSAFVLSSQAGAQSLRELQYLEDRNTHAILHAPPPRDEESDRRWREVNCSPEEDLSGPGRLLATAVGLRLRNSGVRVNRVVTSPMCNAVATAGLLKMDPVSVEEYLAPEPPEGGTPEDLSDQAAFHLASMSAERTALVITHGRNIADLTGAETVPGELLIVSVSPLGEIEVRFSIEP